MKTLILVLISFTSYCQVSQDFVESTIGYPTVRNDTIAAKAEKLSNSILQQIATKGDYEIEDDGWYGELQTYVGDKQGVEALILQDKEYYKDARFVFVYCDYDIFSDYSLVLIYKFF